MFVDVRTQSLVLQVRDPFRIRDLLPCESRTLMSPHGNIVVKHTLETTRLLRNLGIQAPSPIRVTYPWPGQFSPYDHQEVMADTLTLHDRCFNLSEPGCGKTYAALWAADYLMGLGEVHRALICAPLSTLNTVWTGDIFKILLHRQCAVVHGSMEKRLKALDMDVDFYILNHDGIALTEVAKLIRKRKDIDLIILDEAQFFRNSRTDKYKFLSWILERKRRFWPMTGTPTPNAPTDAWSLAKLVNPTAVPKFFGAFQRETMAKVTAFKWVPLKGSDELVYKALRPAVRFKKAECLSLPPVTILNRQTRMTKEQRTAFEEMRESMIANLGTGGISAVNAADQINKLRQILCGAVKDPTTNRYTIINHSYRLSDLKDAIEEANAKVIVIVPFKGIIRALETELSVDYSVGVLNGDITPTTRTSTIAAFKTRKDPHVLLCHPRVMAHGLNLTEADTTILYAPIYSNDEYQQVIERFNRIGQMRHMNIFRLAAHPLEWSIYKMVDNKALSQDNILSLYRQVTE